MDWWMDWWMEWWMHFCVSRYGFAAFYALSYWLDITIKRIEILKVNGAV